MTVIVIGTKKWEVAGALDEKDHEQIWGIFVVYPVNKIMFVRVLAGTKTPVP